MSGNKGGAAGGSGYAFQDELAAYFAVKCLEGQATSPSLPFDSAADRIVERIDLEAPQPVDDVNVITNDGTFFFQAKTSLSLSDKEDSKFDGVARQFSHQFAQWQGNSKRHALVLAVSRSAPGSIRTDLRGALESLRVNQSGAWSEALGKLSKNRQGGITKLLSCLKRHWQDETFLEDPRKILKHIYVYEASFTSGEGQRVEATNSLGRTVLADPKQSDLAWDVLVRHCQSLASLRGHALRAELRDILTHQGLELERSAKSQRDERLGRQTVQAWRAESVERCVARWEALKVEPKLARELAADPQVGADLSLNPDEMVTLLIGDFGVGKSLALEKLFQRATDTYLKTEDAPVPVWLHASELSGASVTEKVKQRVQDANEYLERGAAVFVDGADESSQFALSVRDLEGQARAFTNTFRGSVLIATRPSSVLEERLDRKNRQLLPKLSPEESLALISRIADKDVTDRDLLGYSDSIRRSAELPLFAVLLGSRLKEGATEQQYLTEGELLDWLVNTSLKKPLSSLTDAYTLLQRLAVQNTEHGGPVEARDVGDPKEINSLLATKLVVERSELLDFPTPILGQWFAAQSIGDTDFDLKRFISDPLLAQRWFYPMLVFMSSHPQERVARFLDILTRSAPSLASRLVKEAIPSRWEPVTTLPTPLESGRQIREAMDAWSAGIGKLAKDVMPLDSEGRLMNVGIDIANNKQVSVAWRPAKASGEPQVSHIPHSHLWDDPNWQLKSTRSVAAHPGWAWEWTHNWIKGDLKRILERGGFLPKTPAIVNEARWAYARAIGDQRHLIGMRQGNLELQMFNWWLPISLEFLRETAELMQKSPGISIISRTEDEAGNKIYGSPHKNPQAVLDFIALLEAEGITEVVPPWPLPTRTREEMRTEGGGPFRWSPDQFLTYTERVFREAADALDVAIATWFTTFTSQIDLLSPIHLIGSVEAPGHRHAQWSGGIHWFAEPGTPGARNSVDFRLKESEEGEDEWYVERSYNRFQVLGETHSQITGLGGLLDVGGSNQMFRIGRDTPVSEVMSDWLGTTLHRSGWVDMGTRLQNDYNKKNQRDIYLNALTPLKQ